MVCINIVTAMENINKGKNHYYDNSIIVNLVLIDEMWMFEKTFVRELNKEI